MRASTSSENISNSRAPGSVVGALCGRCCLFQPFWADEVRCGWESTPASLSLILFLRCSQRDARVLTLSASTGMGESSASAALVLSASGSGLTVTACCMGESQSVVVDEAGEGALSPLVMVEQSSAVARVIAGASIPLERASSRAARVWWTQ